MFTELRLYKRVFVRLYEDLVAAGISPVDVAEFLRTTGVSDEAIDDMFTAFSMVALEKGNVTTVDVQRTRQRIPDSEKPS